EAPERVASSTRGVIWEGHFHVNTPHERKMTFLSMLDEAMCITAGKRLDFQGFPSTSPVRGTVRGRPYAVGRAGCPPQVLAGPVRQAEAPWTGRHARGGQHQFGHWRQIGNIVPAPFRPDRI